MRQKILRELWRHKGEFVSGNQIANQLNMSRVAVWKHINILKNEGYQVIGTKGKGYSLKDYHSIIVPEEVTANLNTRLIGKDIRFYSEVDSTNEVLKRMLMNNESKEGMVVAALNQEKGKGRLRREWNSPRGGLWFSLILNPSIALERVALFSLVFAVAVAAGIEQLVNEGITIKWPNDIYIREKKVAGILLELSGELDGTENIIMGCGINVNIKKHQFPGELQNGVTSLLEEYYKYFDNNELLITILQSIEKYYFRFITCGFEDILDEFKAYCNHLGKEVQVNQGDKTIIGITSDIDINGSLVINTGEKEVKLSTGDVSVV
jgi:BirA family biotin operon repressor/biotin-[acetyl-CoA-carboxylase] ligase